MLSKEASLLELLRFDTDGAINATKRTLRESLRKLRVQCDEARQSLRQALQEATRASPAEQRLMADEVRVCETRSAFLDAVAAPPAEGKLKDHP